MLGPMAGVLRAAPTRGRRLRSFAGSTLAVTPIIAVILMVAVTVVLGTVVYVITADIGSPKQGDFSTATLEAVADSTPGQKAILIRHVTGDRLDANQWRVSVTLGSESGPSFTQPCTASFDAGDLLRVQAKDTSGGAATCDDATVSNAGGSAIGSGIYHIKVAHIHLGVTLIDLNVEVG